MTCKCTNIERDSQGNKVTERKSCKGECKCSDGIQGAIIDNIGGKTIRISTDKGVRIAGTYEEVLDIYHDKPPAHKRIKDRLKRKYNGTR